MNEIIPYDNPSLSLSNNEDLAVDYITRRLENDTIIPANYPFAKSKIIQIYTDLMKTHKRLPDYEDILEAVEIENIEVLSDCAYVDFQNNRYALEELASCSTQKERDDAYCQWESDFYEINGGIVFDHDNENLIGTVAIEAGFSFTYPEGYFLSLSTGYLEDEYKNCFNDCQNILFSKFISDPFLSTAPGRFYDEFWVTKMSVFKE